KLVHKSSSTTNSERTKSETEATAPKVDKEQGEVSLTTVTSRVGIYVRTENQAGSDPGKGHEALAGSNLEPMQEDSGPGKEHVDLAVPFLSCLDKLIECQIVDNCKKGLGYEKYNAVLPPYIGNFMPPTPDLSFTGLDEFVNEPVVENSKSMSRKEEPKVARMNDDAPIIEEWVSDSEEENVSQTKTQTKTVKPSIAKIEFVKPKQQEKTARKTVKQVKKHRQNTHSPRGNQRN
ncbi:hypothetical protein Tco_1490006, partial [Tanacetum coccineum]